MVCDLLTFTYKFGPSIKLNLGHSVLNIAIHMAGKKLVFSFLYKRDRKTYPVTFSHEDIIYVVCLGQG